MGKRFKIRRKQVNALLASYLSLSLLLGILPPILMSPSANIEQAFANTENSQSSIKKDNGNTDTGYLFKEASTKQPNKIASNLVNKMGDKTTDTDNEKKQLAEKALPKINVPFIKNQGQEPNNNVKYYADIFSGTLFITGDGVLTYALIKPQQIDNVKTGKKTKNIVQTKNRLMSSASEQLDRIQTEPKEQIPAWVLKEELIGAKQTDIKPVDKSDTKINYFIGKDKSKWKTDVQNYETLSLGEIYQSINLSLQTHGNNVEKIFTVNPGGSPSDIKIKLDGAHSLSITSKGELELTTGMGPVSFTKPVAYQAKDGAKKNVPVEYEVEGNTYGFKVGSYDRNLPLVIDPLLASTFVGDTTSRDEKTITVDNQGNIIIVGDTDRSRYPTTPGAYDTTLDVWEDVFVSKFDPDLSTLVSSTFIGGSRDDLPLGGVLVDSQGYIYVSGITGSTDFPSTPGTYNPSGNNRYYDPFVIKLNNDLTSLTASTSISGNWSGSGGYAFDSDDGVYGSAIDSAGSIYICGYMRDSVSVHKGFIAKFSSDLVTLQGFITIGSSGATEAVRGIAIDGQNNIFAVGQTGSTDLPVSSASYDTTPSSTYVAKINSSLTGIQAATYLSSGFASKLATDSLGNVYVLSGGILKLNGDLTNALASFSIPGITNAGFNAITIDDQNDVFLTGQTGSGYDDGGPRASYLARTYQAAGEFDTPGFLTTEGVYDTTYNGGFDAFIMKLGSNLTTLKASTYIGGMYDDCGEDIVLDQTGNVLITGLAWSPDFPTSTGAFRETSEGSNTFISRFTNDLSEGEGVVEEDPDLFRAASMSVKRPVLVLIAGLYSNSSDAKNEGDVWKWFRNKSNLNSSKALGKVFEKIIVVPTKENATSPTTIDSRGFIYDNKNRLANFLKTKKSEIKNNPVILVGHSMGGIIARAFLDDGECIDHAELSKDQVWGIIQIGSPNFGSKWGDLIKIDFLNIKRCNATYDLSTERMDWFNILTRNLKYRPIYVHAGTAYPCSPFDSSISGFARSAGVLISGVLGGINDSTVSFASASGSGLNGIRSVNAYPFQHSVDAIKGSHILPLVPTDELQESNNNEKIYNKYKSFFSNIRKQIAELSTPPTIPTIRQASLAQSSMFQAASLESEENSLENENIASSLLVSRVYLIETLGAVSKEIRFDTKTNILLSSQDGTPTVSIKDSNNQIQPIEPESMMIEASSENEADRYITLVEFNPSSSGTCNVEVGLENGGSGIVMFNGFAENGPKLSLKTDTYNILSGSYTTVTATIEDSGAPVMGATTMLVADDGENQTLIALSDNGVAPDTTANDGVYTGTLSTTGATGIWDLKAMATGSSFEREAQTTIAVGSPSWAQFSGSLSETTTAGAGSTIKQWSLVAPIIAASAGSYTLKANIYDASGNVVAQPSSTFDLSANESTSTLLSVDSEDFIVADTAVGSLAVKDISLYKVDDSGGELLADETDDFTTDSYSENAWEAFRIGLDPVNPDPATERDFTFTGSAVYTPGSIAQVEYSIDLGATWQNATPVDGNFDEAYEEYSFDVNGLADGLHGVLARATTSDEKVTDFNDYAGDRFIIDNIAPTAVDSLSAEETETGVRLTWIAPEEASQTTAGISYQVKLDDNEATSTLATTYELTLPNDGAIHTITVTAVDDAGNRGSDSIINFSAGPQTTITLDPSFSDGFNGWYRTVPLIDLSSDEPSAIYYRWDDGQDNIYSGSFDALEGEHVLTVHSVGESGLVEPEHNQTIKVDTTAPTIPTLNPVPTINQSNQTAVSIHGLAEPDVLIGVFASDGENSVFTTTTSTGSFSATLDVSDLADGPIAFAAAARDEAGNVSPFSLTQTATKNTAPTTPTNLTATPNGLTQVDLTWSPSTDTAGITGYRVERSTDAASYSQIATSLNNNYSDTSVTAQDTYYYRVRAYDEAGHNSSYSNVAQISILPTLRYEESASDILYESSPEVDSWDWQTHKDSELSGQFEKYTYTQGNSFTLTFTGTSVSLISTKGPNKGIAEIYVDGEYEQDVDLYSPTIDIYQAPVYTNDNLLLGVHSIKVVCSGQKNFAADDCAVGIDYFDVVGIADTQAPGAPTSLAGTTTETDTVSLCWGPAIDNVAVTGYSVERSTDGSSYEQIATVAPRTFNYTDQTAISGTSYFYCIKAYDAAANVSSASNILQTNAVVATRYEEHAPEIVYNDGQWWDLSYYLFTGGNMCTSYYTSDTATFTFTGTSVTWISDRNQYQGTAIIYIDNDAPQIIDANVDITDGTIFGPLYTKSGLSAGTHTLKIVVTGEVRPHTWETWVDIDAFDVAGG